LYSEAKRAAIRRLRGPPDPPMTSGIGRCTGFGCASRSTTLKCSPAKLKAPSSHERVAISSCSSNADMRGPSSGRSKP
jgi:hypothetical protein